MRRRERKASAEPDVGTEPQSDPRPGQSDGPTPFERFAQPLLAAANDPTPVFEVGIPTRDGMELAADVYLPPENDRPAPAIVQSTPYDKGNPAFFPAEGRLYQANGYAYVVHDCRGRGKSMGG